MRGVSFDLDGTLASVGWRRVRLWRGLLDAPAVLGAYEPAVRALRGTRALDLHAALVSELVRRSRRPEAEVQAALARWIEGAWPRLYADASPSPALRAALDAVDAAGLPRVVVSDHGALDKLAAMGLSGFAAVIDCGALGAYKPAPDGLWAAAATLGIPASELLHVGDRWDTDGLAAARAGCEFLHIRDVHRLTARLGAGLGSKDGRSP